MQDIVDQTSHIAWLTARLANKRDRILGLIHRLTGLGAAPGVNPILFVKVSRWLNEIAAERRDEMRLMTQIVSVEKQHRIMRLANKLRRAVPSHQISDYPCNEHPKRPLQSLLLWIVLWYLFMRQRINQKKQGLTAD